MVVLPTFETLIGHTFFGLYFHIVIVKKCTQTI